MEAKAAAPRFSKGSTDADIERMMKAAAAACAYEAQIRNVLDGADESQQLIFLTAGRHLLDLRHYLGDDFTLPAAFNFTDARQRLKPGEDLRVHLKGIEQLRASISAELAMLRARARRL